MSPDAETVAADVEAWVWAGLGEQDRAAFAAVSALIRSAGAATARINPILRGFGLTFARYEALLWPRGTGRAAQTARGPGPARLPLPTEGTAAIVPLATEPASAGTGRYIDRS